MEGQQSVTGAEHRHAVGRILARRHYGRIPGLLGQVNHPLQQGIESGARLAIQLDEGSAFEPDAIAHRRSGQPGTTSSIGTDPSRLPAWTASCTACRRSPNPGAE